MQADYVGQDGLPEDCPQCKEYEARIAELEAAADRLEGELENESASRETLADRLDAIREAGGWRR